MLTESVDICKCLDWDFGAEACHSNQPGIEWQERAKVPFGDAEGSLQAALPVPFLIDWKYLAVLSFLSFSK